VTQPMRTSTVSSGFPSLPKAATVPAVLIFLLSFSQGIRADSGEEALARQVQSHFQVGRFEVGEKTLEKFRRKYGESPLLPELELLQAQSQRNSFEGLKEYSAFLSKYPDHRLAPQANLELARLHYVTGNVVSARREASRLVERFGQTPFADEARVLVGEADACLGRHSDAANEFATLLALRPDSSLAPRAQLGLAEAWLQMGKLEAAEKILKGLLSKNDPLVDASHVCYGLGRIYEKTGRRKRAERYYEAIVKQTPDSFFASAAGERLNALSAPKDALAPGALKHPVPEEEYSVLFGRFEPEAAATEAASLQQAGFNTTLRKGPEGKTEILVGSFSTEIQARFFAAELEKKFGRSLSVLKLK